LLTKIEVMKRAAVIALLVFAMGVVLGSCNKQACPAYSQHDTEQIENVG
jgi:hypothetical protein